MKNVFFLPHLGLGDHILCNGMQRHVLKEYDKMVMPVKSNNLKAINRMFSDLNNLYLLPLEGSLSYADDAHMQHAVILANLYHQMQYDIVTMGAFVPNAGNALEATRDGKTLTYDELFYVQAGVPFSEKHNSFYFPREKDKELKLFKMFENLKPGQYIFLHDDPHRGRTINRSLLRSDLPIISPSKKFWDADIFDYGYVVENAAEIHCVNSAFADFIDFLDLSKVTKKCIHAYARPEFPVKYKNSFEVINNE
tara:strand:- start:944 stop:1699 length:756 start_codon:yes stop_codon:yes gene_type:complete